MMVNGEPAMVGARRMATDTVTVVTAMPPGPTVYPVTVASNGDSAYAVMIAEYGPLAGISPDGHDLRTAVLGRWPGVRVFERRSTGASGADPRGYETFYVELEPSGCRTDVDTDEVSALFRP
ncbi:MAG: hypothetical protein ACOH2Q_24150 [Rhodococcus sp. (in: high G+C Gram-positive bacteria)]